MKGAAQMARSGPPRGLAGSSRDLTIRAWPGGRGQRGIHCRALMANWAFIR